MKIATWNLDCVLPGVGARSARIREALGLIDADVWVLTESHPEFVPGAEYRRIALSTQAPDRVQGGCWVVIWVRDGMPAEALVITGEPERAAGVRIARAGDRSIVVFGTVLPWRADTRHGAYRGGRAFERSLAAQATDWVALQDGNELCVAGDFNQEWGANGPVGTRVGRDAFERILHECGLSCVTGGRLDPLQARGWRANIDHVVLSQGLRTMGSPLVWPEQFPLQKLLSDHHGLCLTVADA